MIIDSLKYNGVCTCGSEHKMETERCIIESDCLKKAEKYIEEIGLKGVSAAIYDENTYKATLGSHPSVACEIVLPCTRLHADEKGVALAIEQIPDNCDYLIAIGAGTVHDITRYCAYQKSIPFVACPTAASVDGFCSSVAAMTWNGFKKTFVAAAPRLVIADLDIISQAPKRLTNSGFGDMVGKLIALADWKIANKLTGEFFCSEIYSMTLSATKAVLDNIEGIKKGSTDAYEKLIYGLLMSGLSMQLLGNSRCASGAEHHISHFIEMKPEAIDRESDALHGEKVGVGTLLAVNEYHRLKDSNIRWQNFVDYNEQYIQRVFGKGLSESVILENRDNCAMKVTPTVMEERWTEICNIIDEIPSFDKLMEKYRILNAKCSLDEIGLSAEYSDRLLEYSPLVRNRLTLMRLRRMIKK